MSPLKAEFSLASSERAVRFEAWGGVNTRLLAPKMEEAAFHYQRESWGIWEWPPANSQQGNGDLSPTTTRNQILPTVRRSKKTDLPHSFQVRTRPSQRLDFSLVRL